uniref:60S ribosomal export protein NMD3 n=1 Tax=Knipowitschia caucasica TaxID=637954 RepID=A0AAV2IZB8_KNICA
MNGAILQQVFVVEFVVLSQMCDDCHRVEAKDFWKAVVQVRQKVLIKKSYDRTRRVKRRNWKLQEMARDKEGMDTDDERQYQDFLEDLEEDEALRKNINIYKDTSKIPVESDTDDDGAPRISLAEMLEEMSLNDATGGDGADMMTD